jgi:hypothetical protein
MLRKGLAIYGLTAVVLLGLVALAGCACIDFCKSPPAKATPAQQAPAGDAAASPVSAPGAVLSVRDLRGSSAGLGGEIEVQGVVSSANADRQTFGLVDKREVDECGTTACAGFVLPVHWKGPSPHVGKQVTVVGVLKRSPAGPLLEAARVG